MMNKKNCCKRRNAFTLLEVVAVVAMLSVLTALLLPSVETYVNRTRDLKLTSDLAVVDSAIMLYRMDKGTYPNSLSILQPDYLQRQELTDAEKNAFSYSPDAAGKGYTLTGKNTSGATITSKGSQE